jgi:Cu(I)/Ag(I) efflux system membrane fusion protein
MSAPVRAVAVLVVLAAVAGGGFLLGRRSGEAPVAPASDAVYRCPMHPQVVSNAPGECPICHMRLVKQEPGSPAAGERAASAPPVVAGRTAVTIPAERRQLLGLRSEPVRIEPLPRRIRTVGVVAVDERRVHRAHTKYEGYVERVFVDFTGRRVRRGEPLLELYSPELLATQQEYLSALRTRKQLEESGVTHVAVQGSELVDAARRRLLLWDIPAEAVERLERTGEATRTVTLFAKADGFVVQKNVAEGARVTPDQVLFEIADLARLWVLADVYESDLASVRVGSAGEVGVTYRPGRTWRGRVSQIAPTVDEATRTVKVRLEVDNSGDDLKPGMFTDVELLGDETRALVVPEDAVVDAGDRRIVFVDRGEGRYEPREVRLGARRGQRVEVLAGLAEGDRVVVSANFLLDSESSLRAALAGAVP